MRRLTPLNVAAGLVVTALVAALVAAGAGAGAATQKLAGARTTGAFHRALAAKLGEQLHKPAADVLTALETAHRSRPAGAAAGRRAAHLAARAKRLTARAKRISARAHRRPGRAARLEARAKRLTARASRLAARAHSRAGRPPVQRAHARRSAWAAAVATPLGVSPADVTAALRALIAERLDSLVHDGWLTTDRRDAELECFDDAGRCAGIRRPPGLALLRAGL